MKTDIFHQAFDSSRVGMIIWDGHWRMVEVNDAFCKMLGFRKEELAGKSIIEISHPDDRTISVDKDQKLFSGTISSFQIEKRYLTKSGEAIWVSINPSVLEKDESGKATLAFSTVEDISKRKKLELALKESESNYHTMIEMAPDAVAVHSGGKVIFVNRAGVKLLGATRPEDIIGKPTLSFVHPDSLAVVTERIKKMAETGEMASLLEEKFLRLDGTPVDVEVVARPIVYEGKKAVQVVIHDISESKRIRDEIKKSESRYRILAEASHDMIFVTDRTGTVTYANSFAAAQFGLKPEQMIGKKRADFFGQTAQTQDISLNTVFETGEPLYRETKYPFGEKILWLGTWLIPLKKDGGEVTSILGVSRDISAQKAAELKLLTLNRQLGESEERFRSLFTNMLDGFAHCEMIYDEKNVPVDFVYLDVNDRFTELTGLRDVVGKKVSVVIPGIRESNPELFELYGRAATTGEPGRLETYVPQLSIWFSISVYSPQKGHFVAVFSNITEKKRAEEWLRLSREVIQAIGEAADFSEALSAMLRIVCVSTGWIYGETWVPDPNQGILELDSASYATSEGLEKFRELSKGYTFKPGEGLPGRVWLSKKAEWLPDVSVNGRFFPRGKVASAAGLRAGLGIPIIIEGQVAIVIVFFAAEIREEEKGLIEVVTSLGSQLGLIFQRKRTEEALGKSEEKYRNLVDSMSEGLGVQDKNGLITFMNKRGCEMLGYKLEELIGQPTTMVFDEKNQKILREQMALRRKGEHQSYEIAWLRKDGGKVDTIIAPSPRFDEQDNLVESVAVFTDITDRKKVEDDLKKEKSFMELLINSLPGIYYLFDQQGKFIRWNQNLLKVGGYSEEEMLRLTPVDFFSDEEKPAIAEKIKEVFSNGYAEIEGNFLTKSGVKIPHYFNGARVMIDGKWMLSGMGIDITARKRLEYEFIVSEKRYRRLFESAKDGILIADFNTGLIVDVNEFLIKLLGYTKDDFLKKHLWDIGVFKNIVASKANFEELKSKDYVRYEDQPMETKDGKKIEVEFISNVYLVDSTKTIQCNVRDITARRMAEEEVVRANGAVEEALKITASEKAKLETVLNGIADGVFVIDDHGKIVLFNRAAEKISGFSFDNIKEKQYWEVLNFVPEGLSETKVDFIRNALSGHDGELEVNLSFKKASGKVIPIQASAATLDGRGKQSLGIVVIFRDVSKERELQQLRDEFMMIASHELRAPMTAIKWLVSMMLEGSYGSVGDNLKSPLGTIASSTDRLIHLVNDMINITRVEAGNMRLTLTDFDIKKMIDDLLVTFGSEAKKNNIQIDAVGVESVMIQADSDWTAQILSNLIDNAIKFNREGGKITLSAKKDNDFLNIAIADTGIGIPDDFREKLFTKFAQVLSKKAGKPIGTGLGLFISRELARGMGGDLSLTSTKIEEGSTFVINIPLSGSPTADITLANHKKKTH